MFVTLGATNNMNLSSRLPALPRQTEPRFPGESRRLVGLLRCLRPAELAVVLGADKKQSVLAAEEFKQWQEEACGDDHARAALFAFQGHSYSALNVASLDSAQLAEAQQRLRILSGLYGLLRPLDRIRRYRLPMQADISRGKGADLYYFWGDCLAQQLADDMTEAGSRVLLDLAAPAYSRVINPKAFPFPVITPVFKEGAGAKNRASNIETKKARGLMAAWIIKENIRRPDDLPAFAAAGYAYDAESSTLEQPVFCRS